MRERRTLTSPRLSAPHSPCFCLIMHPMETAPSTPGPQGKPLHSRVCPELCRFQPSEPQRGSSGPGWPNRGEGAPPTGPEAPWSLVSVLSGPFPHPEPCLHSPLNLWASLGRPSLHTELHRLGEWARLIPHGGMGEWEVFRLSFVGRNWNFRD